MNNKNRISTLMITSLTVIGLLFQNFDFISSLNAETLPHVDQKTRVKHAKELLGKGYTGSKAQQAEKISDLHVTIFNNVYQHLPKKYQSQTRALTEAILEEAEAHDLDPVFVMAVIKTESCFNPKARGSHGEIGLMQIKPDTAQWIAKQEGIRWRGPSTLENPVLNVKIGVAYISQLREKSAGYANRYLSSYNLGPAKVTRMYQNAHTPHEYSTRVMKNYKDIYSGMVASRATTVAENN